MPAIGCQFAAWRAQLVQLRLLRPVADLQGCDNQATHLTTLPHRPLTVAALEY